MPRPCLYIVVIFSFAIIYSQQSSKLHYVEKRLPYPIYPYKEKTDDVSRRFQSLFYETLIDDNPQNNDYEDRHINYASCRLEENRFIFELEDEWQWNDFSGAVSRYDVKFSIEEAVRYGLFNPIKVLDVQIQGNNAIELQLDRNYPLGAKRDILDKLRQVVVIPQPDSGNMQGEELEIFAQSPVGTGPFQWDVASGSRIQLLAVDGSTSRLGRASIDEVVIERIPLLMQHWQEMRTFQEINLLIEATRFSKVEAEASTGYRVKPYASDKVVFLLFNYNNDLFQDKPFRLAIDLCIDKERLVAGTLQGEGDILTGPFSQKSPYYKASVKDNGYSPDSARKLLNSILDWDAESEYFMYLGEPAKLRLIYDRGLNHEEGDVITQIVSELKKIGISVTRRPLNTLNYRMALNTGNFDLAYFKHHYDRKAFAHQFFSSNRLLRENQYTDLNFGKYDNNVVDVLVEEWLRADDRSSQQRIGQQVHSVLNRDVACIFLYSQTAYAIHVRELEPIIVPFYFFGRPHEWTFTNE